VTGDGDGGAETDAGRGDCPDVPRLYVVGTPIGNLGDLTVRAARVLASVDAVICEDTRRTGRLLSHVAETVGGEWQRPDLLVANEHTEVPRIAEVLRRLDDCQTLALVTDAGMPTISDPGRHVVAAVADHGVAVEVVPGPTAVSAALALSALATERYVFEGFLPRKGRERTDRLADIGAEARTVVLYEAPHRLTRTLSDLAAVCGPDRPVAVARELTKLHEEVLRTTLGEAGRHFAATEPRGEFVLVVAGRPVDNAPVDDEALLDALRQAVADGMSKRDAVADVVERTGQPKRRVYDLSTRL
jgi:16S rRNA (cytidine1402-2'-O)-methyltransferase